MDSNIRFLNQPQSDFNSATEWISFHNSNCPFWHLTLKQAAGPVLKHLDWQTPGWVNNVVKDRLKKSPCDPRKMLWFPSIQTEPFGAIKKVLFTSSPTHISQKRKDLGKKTICSSNTSPANHLNIWVVVHWAAQAAFLSPKFCYWPFVFYWSSVSADLAGLKTPSFHLLSQTQELILTFPTIFFCFLSIPQWYQW